MTCVRSGYCCKQRPCPFGTADDSGACVHLVPDPASTAGQYLCAKYEEIRRQPGAELSPAFGAGCSSTMFNRDRELVLVRLGRRP